MNSNVINWLFETSALRVCPADKPFWYTSGTVGPYYINTHFLYGSEKSANELLSIIDEATKDKLSAPQKIYNEVLATYNNCAIFKGLIDAMKAYILDNIDIDKIGYISGGERRDWFFSIILAHLLNKPHIWIFKDCSCVLQNGKDVRVLDKLETKANVLHIADLITEASSYERAWVPAIKAVGGVITDSLVVVDRKQGGKELLKTLNVRSHTMVSVDYDLFDTALANGKINDGQYAMIKGYIDDPKASMKAFLQKHPEFMENALNGDEKTAARAKLCLKKGFYN